MNSIAALLVAASAAISAEAIKPVVAETHRLEPHFIGFNQPFAGQTQPWSRGSLLKQFQLVQGANFRFPAGTLGTYWNWKTGRVEETLDPQKVMGWVRPLINGRGDYKPADLQIPAKQAGCAPVFMLGMVVHSLDEYIAELRQAETLGIPVRYIELGNEIIFNNAEPLLEEKFPTAERYGEVATEWIAALKKAFPNAKVAACGSFVSSDSQSERRRTWNERMMKTLKGADAITFHLYVRDVLRSEQERVGLSEVEAQRRATKAEANAPNQPLTKERVDATLGIVDSFLGKSFEKTKMPAGMDVWVTEFSAGGAGGSSANWLGGLVTAALLDACLRRSVTLTCHHTMGVVFGAGGGRGQPQSTSTELNSFGLALRAYASATTGMTSSTRLDFPTGPQIVLPGGGRRPGVLGWTFRNAEGNERALLINLLDEQVTLRMGQIINERQAAIQYHAPPHLPASQVQAITFETADELLLPPYSLTVMNPLIR